MSIATTSFEQLREQQREAAEAFREAKAEYRRLTEETYEAYCQERFGRSHRLTTDRTALDFRASLAAVAPDGSAVYTRDWTAGRTAYIVREADGTVAPLVTSKAKLPQRRWTWVEYRLGLGVAY